MSIQAVTSTNEGVVPSGTLREAIEIRRVRGERYSMREAIAIVVPLCTHLAQLHAEGRRFLLHPSALLHGKAGDELDLAAAALMPTHVRDRAVIAPECRKGEAGDAHATVFSIGAILYELVTGESVGPGMKRPREANPSLPPSLEIILGKALVGDPKHRPHDIAALAQAFHHLAPAGSMPPPPADESHLDHEDGFDVDVSLSMLPPEAAPNSSNLSIGSSNGTAIMAPMSGPGSQRQPFVAAAQGVPPSSRNYQLAGAGPFTTIEAPRSAPNPDDPTVQLAALKQKLESDPRPRYVVVKDGMDHGPFTAVELLQQMASHSFTSEHPLRDSLSGQERPISEWQEFSLFAHQAGLNREIKQERKALEEVVRAERHRTQWKALVGATLLGLVVAAVVGYGVRKAVQASSNKRDVRTEDNTSTDSTAALSGAAQDPSAAKVGGGSYVGGAGGGKFPQVGGGSCEAAQAAYVEDYTKSGTQPDLTVGAYAGVLNNGGYLNACGVPDNMSVSICAAVQNGHAVGITVTTNPSNPGVAGCIRGQVAGLGFPSNPRLDVARTTFAAVSK